MVWNAPVSIADKLGEALRCAAFHEAVRKGADFSSGFPDRHACLIALGNCTPRRLGAMPYAAKNCLNRHPARPALPP
jgi:N-methylhydantoinase B/oxoprolinase/acetone carboxylase alpha subunit